MTDLPLIRSHLYAPGNNPRLLDKVFLADADAVILDLEDAVPPLEKSRARDLVAETVRHHAGRNHPPIFVRINHPSSGFAQDDVGAVVQPGLSGLRLPKVEDAATVRQVATWMDDAEKKSGLSFGTIVLVCTIESAAGVFRAYEIATSHPRVIALGYGAADFVRDLGLVPTPENLETLSARSHLVLASRVAGIRAPVDAVHTQITDLLGLEQNARQARSLGFFGKSAIHPSQVPIINAIFTPSELEIAHARQVLRISQNGGEQGVGALKMESGEFVDQAVLRRAQDILELEKEINRQQMEKRGVK